jgi:hypothetical protein
MCLFLTKEVQWFFRPLIQSNQWRPNAFKDKNHLTPGHLVSGISKLLQATKENRFHQYFLLLGFPIYFTSYPNKTKDFFGGGGGHSREVLNIFFCGLCVLSYLKFTLVQAMSQPGR